MVLLLKMKISNITAVLATVFVHVTSAEDLHGAFISGEGVEFYFSVCWMIVFFLLGGLFGYCYCCSKMRQEGNKKDDPLQSNVGHGDDF